MPTDIDENGISDEILDKAQAYIQERLKSKRLSVDKRAELEIQGYFFMFLVQDHHRMGKIYPYVMDMKARQDNQKGFWNKILWIVIPLLITGLAGFVAQAWIFWATFIPLLPKLQALP